MPGVGPMAAGEFAYESCGTRGRWLMLAGFEPWLQPLDPLSLRCSQVLGAWLDIQPRKGGGGEERKK